MVIFVVELLKEIGKKEEKVKKKHLVEYVQRKVLK